VQCGGFSRARESTLEPRSTLCGLAEAAYREAHFSEEVITANYLLLSGFKGLRSGWQASSMHEKPRFLFKDQLCISLLSVQKHEKRREKRREKKRESELSISVDC